MMKIWPLLTLRRAGSSCEEEEEEKEDEEMPVAKKRRIPVRLSPVLLFFAINNDDASLFRCRVITPTNIAETKHLAGISFCIRPLFAAMQA